MGPPRHLGGLWTGEALPADELKLAVPANPIRWSLVLLPTAPGSAAPSAFGGGFFDDAGDVPGTPVLLFTLDGTYDEPTGSVSITKRYVARAVPEELTVLYTGKLEIKQSGEGGGDVATLTGSWVNQFEGTYGVFACVLEPPAEAQPAAASAAASGSAGAGSSSG